MPIDADRADCLVDTSVAVPLVLPDHEHHAAAVAGSAGRHLGLAGHAAFETFSVLTRLPSPARRTPAAVTALLRARFPGTLFLSPEGNQDLLENLAGRGIGGGAVYDALVGATAAEHGLPLLTRDRRAQSTYRALGVQVHVLERP